ncbi:oxidoreductase [Dyadobacter frigoris]|uniref:SDR family NAD(P)-dependent oxidoreductase n=1 Tax=Dyadobacter frigoris TaxID=2576211 RepID=A0A4U6CZU1_9BACT|nr:oxidoreductase [Dyadobacter frigoris]TKT90420.1 SDR family NAD(P)-dependent oxidoreductase [Dyadobacter frigoris]GLU51458.1 short-chain dehydrogenase [Dyadobacter frigoris]
MKNENNRTNENSTDQSGRTVIVTGANIGIGFETARALYEAGAHVILACRNQQNAEEALAKMQEKRCKGSLEINLLDLSGLESVKVFAEKFLQNHDRLDLLINNAGVANPPDAKTAEGFELQFSTNFLGHFALTAYLYPVLSTTAGSRIISLSSIAYLHGQIDFENLKSEKSYDASREYCQSKLAATIFGIELQRKLTAAGSNVLSLIAQPGANNTGLARHMSEEAYDAAVEQMGPLMEPWQGALSSLFAATSPDVIAGGFYQPDQDGGLRGFPVQAEIDQVALNESVNRKLWSLAERFTGQQFPLVN